MAVTDHFGVATEEDRPKGKVVIGFVSGNMEDLEKEINDVILRLENAVVLDVKYSAVPTAIATHTE